MAPLASVQQGDFFLNRVGRLKAQYERIDEYVKGAIWVLERSPKEGKICGEPMANYRILNMGPPLKGMPEVAIVYSTNGHQIKLFDIMIVS